MVVIQLAIGIMKFIILFVFVIEVNTIINSTFNTKMFIYLLDFIQVSQIKPISQYSKPGWFIIVVICFNLFVIHFPNLLFEKFKFLSL